MDVDILEGVEEKKGQPDGDAAGLDIDRRQVLGADVDDKGGVGKFNGRRDCKGPQKR